ncbi:PqqD family protein [Myxococcota bacterium]|nr:PqqD family protein [Myxococcota bacterium]
MRLVKSSNIKEEALPDGEIMLVSDQGGKVVVLNSLGAVVWTLCDGHSELREIITIVTKHFSGVPREQVEGDVENFVVQLRDAGLIREA